MSAPRIGLIHALAHSVAPINQAFAELWPQARLMNVLDDSLSADLAANGRGLDAVMDERFMTLASYAVEQGCEGLLFTCSAFGTCIEKVAAHFKNIPVLKPNEAMIAEAAQLPAGSVIGLIASFAPTLESMPAEFPAGTVLKMQLAENALAALNRGDVAQHDADVVKAALNLIEQGCTAIALSQFSMARAAEAVRAATGVPVLTTPESAVRRMRELISLI